MHYKRMPIEIEAPEGYGYENIDCNLSESSFTDQRLSDLGIDINDLVLFYGDHKGKPALREMIVANTNLNTDDVLVRSIPISLALIPIIVTMHLPKDVAIRSVGENLSPLPWLSVGASVSIIVLLCKCVASVLNAPL